MTTARHTARNRHLRICREENWGKCPAQPAWQCVPVSGDGYRPAAVAGLFAPATQFGGWRRAVLLEEAKDVRGEFVCLAWPQVTALLLGMALDRSGDALASYCLDYYTPADARRHLGAKVERMELVATSRSRPLEIRLVLRGRAEEANATLTEGDFDYANISPVPFALGGTRVSVDGAELTGIEGFRLRVENHLVTGPPLAGAPAFLIAGRRTIALELSKSDDDAALKEALRAGTPVAFEAQFAHPEGHTLGAQLPRLHVVTNQDSAVAGELAGTVARMEAAADEAGQDITWSLDLNP